MRERGLPDSRDECGERGKPETECFNLKVKEAKDTGSSIRRVIDAKTSETVKGNDCEAARGEEGNMKRHRTNMAENKSTENPGTGARSRDEAVSDVLSSLIQGTSQRFEASAEPLRPRPDSDPEPCSRFQGPPPPKPLTFGPRGCRLDVECALFRCKYGVVPIGRVFWGLLDSQPFSPAKGPETASNGEMSSHGGKSRLKTGCESPIGGLAATSDDPHGSKCSGHGRSSRTRKRQTFGPKICFFGFSPRNDQLATALQPPQHAVLQIHVLMRGVNKYKCQSKDRHGNRTPPMSSSHPSMWTDGSFGPARPGDGGPPPPRENSHQCQRRLHHHKGRDSRVRVAPRPRTAKFRESPLPPVGVVPGVPGLAACGCSKAL